MTVPACCLMLVTFLYELTAVAPDMRSAIYKTELTKVFFSVLHFYLCSMIFANWLQSLRKFVINVNKHQQRLAKNKTPVLPKVKKDFISKFTLSRFTLIDVIDLAFN